MGKRGPRKVKNGVRKNLYLSIETVKKASQLSDNLSGLCEGLIEKEWSRTHG